MAAGKIVLVTGATGKQGGATLRHLAKRGGFKLRAATPMPERVGYSADIPSLEARWGIRPRTLQEWAQQNHR